MKRLLVANRGEIARRVMRTARAMGIETVAVFSDLDAHAPHVGDADLAVALPGGSAADTYLRIDRIVAAARATGADAVHPGYGFLSESAPFARACADAGLTFVGPPPDVIEAMGSKVAAKALMADAGVPVLGADGFPLLVKAAFGGGGRGMRVVHDEADLVDALAAAEREAAAAFGDGTVFVERMVENPRHVEVQIFGDTHGTVLHLFERECSIQRRYQKVIEEAPSPAVDDALRAELCEAAVAAGRALGYVGAGTVEFVLAPNGEFFFLEVNTRLQVEHPVTEMVTGLDLVEWQLRVARGERIDHLRPALHGHAVEARLYAEDVAAGFAPVAGRVDRFSVPVGPGTRVDTGYESGSVVSTAYDAMLAKVIAHGDDRDQAVDRLVDVLAAARVDGVATNRTLLLGVLDHPEFRAGRTDTGFLTRHDPAVLAASPVDPVAPVAAALALRAERRAAAAVQPSVPAGWRNVPTALHRVRFRCDGAEVEVGYAAGRDGAPVAVEVDGVAVAGLRVWAASATAVDLTVDGVRRRYEVRCEARHEGTVVHVDRGSVSTRLVEVDRLPAPVVEAPAGALVAPLPGAVLRVLVGVGESVSAGQALVVLEAMKMEHRVVSAHDGVVAEVRVAAGDHVDSGQVLVRLDHEPG